MTKHNSDNKQKTEKLPKLKREKLPTLDWKIGTDELWTDNEELYPKWKENIEELIQRLK